MGQHMSLKTNFFLGLILAFVTNIHFALGRGFVPQKMFGQAFFVLGDEVTMGTLIVSVRVNFKVPLK